MILDHIDVTCDEICVCCRQVFKRARDFIRDAKRHQHIQGAKRVYINQMCDELCGRADKELEEDAQQSGRTTSAKKRRIDVLDDQPPSKQPREPRREKSGRVPEHDSQPLCTAGECMSSILFLFLSLVDSST